MAYKLGKGSIANLKGGSNSIRSLVEYAIKITDVDFSVIETIRTVEQQQINVEKGVSWTMQSYHLIGEAVDLYPWVDGKTSHDPDHYKRIAKAMFKAAHDLDIELEWGGFWKTSDMPHWQVV